MDDRPRNEAAKKVAVVGSGCAGLAALWALSSTEHNVYLYEADNRLGGHTNTVQWKSGKYSVDVDTGFIVMNTATYPNFINFLKLLNIPTEPTTMALSVSKDKGSFEWSGKNLASVFCQISNLFSIHFWRMLFDVIRFNQFALDVLINAEKDKDKTDSVAVGEFLESHGYSHAFRDLFLVPITAAVWSTSPEKCIKAFPTLTLIRFLWNHHELSTLSARPQWLTLKNGSRSYVDALMKTLRPDHIFNSTTVLEANNLPNGQVVLRLDGGDKEVFDHVILATHGDQALSILGSTATKEERSILSAFQISQSEVVLHSDIVHMPKRRKAWASWNFMTVSPPAGSLSDRVSVTYNMNILQHIPEDKFGPVLVTLNPLTGPDPALVQGRFSYSHPLYTPEAIHAQRKLSNIQNTRGISYAGAWTRFGFHEDGFTSGLLVAQNHLGAKLPFSIADSTKSRGSRPQLGIGDYIARFFIILLQTFVVRPLEIFAGVSRAPLKKASQESPRFTSENFVTNDNSSNLIAYVQYLSCGISVMLKVPALVITHFKSDLRRTVAIVILLNILPHVSQIGCSKLALYMLAFGLASTMVAVMNNTIRGDDEPNWPGLGKPYLIPCRTSHRRFIPKKHAFNYSYFAVGVPVGFKGSVNGMISVDQGSTSQLRSLSFFKRLRSMRWFTVSASDYLQRDRTARDLRDKLDEYLHSQHLNVANFPHAYLITAPSVFGYQFNPVAIWYLYSATKVLSAVMFEVNNTFGERHPYIFLQNRATGDEHILRGTQEKRFYVSPFNARNGSYSIRTSNPLCPDMRSFHGIDLTITLNTCEGKPKLVAHLFSEGPGIDPSELNIFSKLIFLLKWSWLGFATFPRIIKEAASLLMHRRIPISERPGPLTGTLARPATDLERTLESCFRKFLEFAVSQYQRPVRIKLYTNGLLGDPEIMQNALCDASSEQVEALELRVLTPAFYTRLVQHEVILGALVQESKANGTASISRLDLLSDLLGRVSVANAPTRWLDLVYLYISRRLRHGLTPSKYRSEASINSGLALNDADQKNSPQSIDGYMLTYCETEQRLLCQYTVLRQLLRNRCSVASCDVLSAFTYICRISAAWMVATFLIKLVFS